MTKVILNLGAEISEALKELSRAEFRTPRDQAVYMLRRELERLGLVALAEVNIGVEHPGTEIDQ